MTSRKSIFVGLAVATILATNAIGASQANEAAKNAAEARQSLMHLYAFNLGLLGGMAKGEVDYDADTAQTAATNLHTLASMNQMSMWISGSGTDALGDETDALPAIWEADSKIMDHVQELQNASSAMKTAGGESLESLRGAMQPLGQACGGCHKLYRQKD